MTIQEQIVSAADHLAVQANKVNARIAAVTDFLLAQPVKVEAWCSIYARLDGVSTTETHHLGFCRHRDWTLSLVPACGVAEDSRRHLSTSLDQCSLPDRILACQHLDGLLAVYHEVLRAQLVQCADILGEV